MSSFPAGTTKARIVSKHKLVNNALRLPKSNMPKSTDLSGISAPVFDEVSNEMGLEGLDLTSELELVDFDMDDLELAIEHDPNFIAGLADLDLNPEISDIG